MDEVNPTVPYVLAHYGVLKRLAHPSISFRVSHKGTKSKVKGKGVPRQAEVAQGVPGRLKPRIILTFRHYKGGRSSVKRTGRLYPRRNPWYSLSEAESTSWLLSGVLRKNIPSDTTGNRSGDRLTSSAAP